MFFIKGGYYVFNLLEVYAAGVSLLTTVFFEGNFKLYTATEELYSFKKLPFVFVKSRDVLNKMLRMFWKKKKKKIYKRVSVKTWDIFPITFLNIEISLFYLGKPQKKEFLH